MMGEKDYFAPIDPRLMQAYQTKDFQARYSVEDDVWGLGICSLCFLFNEDFNSFYDWGKSRIRREKIDHYLQIQIIQTFFKKMYK